MTCGECPYSLPCLAGDLNRIKCRSCNRVVVTIERGYYQDMYDPTAGHYQTYEPGHHALICCPATASSELFQTGLACPACRGNMGPIFDSDEDVVEDLSDL